MTDALYYPNYMPDEIWLRSSLLFFDRIHTIVPKEDQESVKRRPFVARLLARDTGIIGLESPTEGILGEAFADDDYEDLSRVIAQIKADVANPLELERAREDNAYRAGLIRSGLGYHIARQKLTHGLFNRLVNSGLAIETDPLYDPELGVYISERPVLTHPRVADFVMARLADAVARKKRVASLTNHLNDFAYNAFYGVRPGSERTVDTDLLATSLKLIVPADIARLPIEAYAEIRDRYEGVREATRDLFASVGREQMLQSVSDLADYADALRDAANLVARRVDKVQQELREQRWDAAGEFTLVSIATLSGAAVGASLGGPVGAIVGAGIPIGAQLLARVAASPGKPRVGRGDTYRALATLRRDIIEAAQIRRVIYPGVVPA